MGYQALRKQSGQTQSERLGQSVVSSMHILSVYIRRKSVQLRHALREASSDVSADP